MGGVSVIQTGDEATSDTTEAKRRTFDENFPGCFLATAQIIHSLNNRAMSPTPRVMAGMLNKLQINLRSTNTIQRGSKRVLDTFSRFQNSKTLNFFIFPSLSNSQQWSLQSVRPAATFNQAGAAQTEGHGCNTDENQFRGKILDRFDGLTLTQEIHTELDKELKVEPQKWQDCQT